MQQKTLTVVVPTYNMEKYLRRCLDSLIVDDERMAQLEVLVVNDGSKDTSSAIAHEYEKKYPGTFRVIDKENGNWGSCINRGIKEATGKYLRLLDSDDRYDKDSFVKLISSLSETDADMVLTNYCIDYGKRKRFCSLPNTIKFGQSYRIEDLKREQIDVPFFQMHSITYKLSVIREVNLTLQEGISYTDTEFVFYPLAAVKKILPLDICLYYWTLGREGQTSSSEKMLEMIDDRYKTTKRVLDDYIKEKNTGSAQREYQAALVTLTMGVYYSVILTIDKTDAEERRARELYDLMKTGAPELLVVMRRKYVRRNGFRYHYFRVWEDTGKYMSNFPYCMINMLNGVRKLIKGE